MDTPTYTPEQEAVRTVKAQKIVAVAGPGSGKSTTLVGRILEDAILVPACRMVAITFTNKAARSLSKKLAAQGINLGFCGTLHRYALHCLREYGHTLGWKRKITVLDEETADGMLKGIADAMRIKDSLAALKRFKMGPDAMTPPGAMVATSYKNTLRKNSAVDFDTLLLEFLRLINRHLNREGTLLAPTCLYVDEYQDSAPIDAQIYAALAPVQLFVVGDSDQSIYAFRGARVANILDLARAPGAVTLRMEGNFRCGAAICTAANGLIAHNTGRIEKATVPMNGIAGEVTAEGYKNEAAEAQGIAGRITDLVVNHNAEESEIAILCRYNHTADALRKYLEGAGFTMATQTKPQRPRNWAACVGAINSLEDPDNDFAAHAWLRYLVHDQAGLAAQAVRAKKSKAALVHELRGIDPSEGIWPSLRKAGIDEECLRYLEAAWTGTAQDTVEAILTAEMQETHHSPVGVQVMTIHAAKGLEWDHVVLAAAEQAQSPGNKEGEPLAEERRLFYVGLTRARQTVTITHAAARLDPWTKQSAAATPSQFIKEALA